MILEYSRWYHACDPQAQKLEVTANGCMIMNCTSFNLEARQVIVMAVHHNDHSKVLIGDMPVDPFVYYKLTLPELYVTDIESPNLPQVYWTGEAWIDKYNQPTYGPMVASAEKTSCGEGQ